MSEDESQGQPGFRGSASPAAPSEPRVATATGDPSGDTDSASRTRRDVLRQVGTGAAAAAGVAIAGCSGDGGGSSSNGGGGDGSRDGGGGGSTGGGGSPSNEGGGETTVSGDGSGGGGNAGSTDNGSSFEAETQALQEEFDTYTEYGYERADAEGTVQSDVDGLEVAESVAVTGTGATGTERFAVLLAMRNAGTERTQPYRYGYHLSVYDADDRLLDDASSQSADGPTVDPEGIGVVTVNVGFTESEEGSLAAVDSYEVLINCQHAGGANPAADGTYCS